MSMFKVGDAVIRKWNGELHYLIVDIDNDGQEFLIHRNKDAKFKDCKVSDNTCNFRHATPEEIAAGYRIDKSTLMQHLEKCEEVVKTWPKWKLQSVRDAFGIPNLETLRDCDTSPNCKKFEERVK